MTILILIVFFIIIAVVKDIPEQKRLQELEKKNEQERLEYQEWYNKLQSSRLFNKTITALFANGFPYELHFGHQNVCYTYDGDWSEYKERTYPRLNSDIALRAFVDCILEKYPGKYSMKICDETDGEGNSTNCIMSIDLIGTWELPSPVKNDPWI